VHGAPFAAGTIADVLLPADLDTLAAAVEALPMALKHNDLMRLHQTQALSTRKAAGAGAVESFRLWLADVVRPWLGQVTGIELGGKIDVFGARYSQGDFLLCHDDELEGRRVAYILYLVPGDWGAADGGALDLFGVDAHGFPSAVAVSLPPQRGKLAFFDVSAVSFHQVHYP
jgi:Rps23 Pro-64 3,4-dihydroxylase Tpa1-like proline 4-hydroxylase